MSQIVVYKDTNCLSCLLNHIWCGKRGFALLLPFFLMAEKTVLPLCTFHVQSSISAYSSLILGERGISLLPPCFVFAEFTETWILAAEEDLSGLWTGFLTGQKCTVFTSLQKKFPGGQERKRVGFKT